MLIKWREQMSVDGAKIDEDHRVLIDIINQFEAESSHFNKVEDALELLYSLKFYSKTHFKREEQLQQAVGYRYHDAHKQEHKSLIKKLDSIIEETRNCDEGALNKITGELAILLNSWLIDHILKSDLRMKPFVYAMRGHMTAMVNLEDVHLDKAEIVKL